MVAHFFPPTKRPPNSCDAVSSRLTFRQKRPGTTTNAPSHSIAIGYQPERRLMKGAPGVEAKLLKLPGDADTLLRRKLPDGTPWVR